VSNPYRFCEEPGVISFSGGRTSGYLLWHVLQAYGGKLPDWLRVIFCNTGREMPETLDFVQECSDRWDVPITWLEFRPGLPGYEVVAYGTASRAGEPFEMLLATPVRRKDRTLGVRPLPNPRSRICTVNLKTRLKKRFVNREWKWLAYHMAIGFRADEANRVARGFKYPEPGETLHYPLHAAGVTKADVHAFWATQPFNLRLPVDKHGETVEGNCDLCFMKSAAKVSAIAARHPERVRWWAEMEARQALTDRATTFRQDRPTYAAMAEAVERGEPMDFGIFDDMTTCGSHGCTD